MPDDGATDAKVVSFPTSTEALGRAIDVSQNGECFKAWFSVEISKVFVEGSGFPDSFSYLMFSPDLFAFFVFIRAKALLHFRQSVYAGRFSRKCFCGNITAGSECS